MEHLTKLMQTHPASYISIEGITIRWLPAIQRFAVYNPARVHLYDSVDLQPAVDYVQKAVIERQN